MTLKLRQIEAFRAVMREGTMVRASAVLSITQPAVSYLIGSLESAVGFPLFVRAKGKLIPTPEAHQLVNEVDRLYEGLDEIETVARLIANHQRAVLRILLTPALSTGACVHAIGRYAAQHPGIRLDIDTAHRATIVRRILAGQADLAVVSLPVETDRIATTRVFSSDLVCVAPAGLPPAAGDAASPADLADCPLIGLKPSGLIRPIVDRWFAAAGVAPRFDVEVRDAWTAIELVRSGVGAAIVARISVPPFGGQPLRTLALAPAERIEIGVVSPAAPHPDRTVESLVAFLRRQLGDARGDGSPA
ncbi:LysR family transcriptional regulator [Pigmentiphaga soli]|uniref:LysR family transcriptional regulator n=1 Tax=Pigmentiphaga soli TaxID=1007095 RepID=A0ABP8HIL2_9BURK